MAKEQIDRRTPTKAEILEILARQGVGIERLQPFRGSTSKAVIAAVVAQLGHIRCGNVRRCTNVILTSRDCVRDHKISLRRVRRELRPEYDRPWNQWYICLQCNHWKTHTVGLGGGMLSDAAAHAKLRRQDRGPKAERACLTKKTPSKPWLSVSRPLSSGQNPWPKRSLKSSRKIPSRPFPGRKGQQDQPRAG